MATEYAKYSTKEVYVVNVSGNTYSVDTYDVIKECPKSFLVKVPGPSGEEKDWTIKYLHKDKAQPTMLDVYAHIIQLAEDKIAHLKHMIDTHQKSIPEIEKMIEDVVRKYQLLELEYSST